METNSFLPINANRRFISRSLDKWNLSNMSLGVIILLSVMIGMLISPSRSNTEHVAELEDYSSDLTTEKYLASMHKVSDTSFLAAQEKRYLRQHAHMSFLLPKLRDGDFPEIKNHNEQIKSIGEELCIPAHWHINLPWPWFVYAPIWNCVHEERIGELFDGGKNHCNIDILKTKSSCVVYSLGSDGKIEYETTLRQRTGCEIHIFDPTVPDERIPEMPEGLFFHKMGLSGSSGMIEVGGKQFPVKSMQEIMTELGHDHLHVLKCDIDGSEYDVFKSLAESGHLENKVDELLLEIHWHGLEDVMNLMDEIDSAGFRIFANEPNLFYYQQPAAGIEYSFIHERVAHEYNTFS